MDLATETHDNALIIDVQEPRLDASCTVAFKDAVRHAITDHDGRVLLDLESVVFLDSSGLGALVGVMKMLGGRRLEVVAPGEIVRKVLKLTRMDQVFVIHDTRQDALAARDAA